MELTRGWKIGIGAGLTAALLIGIAVAASAKSKTKTSGAGGNDKGNDDKKQDAAKEAAKAAALTTTPPPAPANTPPATPNEGETSDIIYISPRIDGGKVIATDTIEVRIANGVFNDGDTVYLHTPQYEGQFPVIGHWDVGDGGGSAFIKTPFIDLGTKNSLGLPIDESPGTISVIAQNAPAQSANGEMNFEGAIIKTDAAKEYGFSMMAPKSSLTHWLTPSEAKMRQAKQTEGQRLGLKGLALRNYIRGGKLKTAKK
jgi:hypothetical protein